MTRPQVFIPDGSPAAPGMPFADNHEDGIYHPAGGAFGIAVNGARGVEVDDDGNLKLMVADAGVLDSNGDPIGGGGGLTSLTEDEDGNLVVSGPLAPPDVDTPIILQSAFKDGGPDSADEGKFFKIIATNYDYAGVPSDQIVFEADEWAGAFNFYADWPLKAFNDSGFVIAVRSGDAGTVYGSMAIRSAAVELINGSSNGMHISTDGVRLSYGFHRWLMNPSGQLVSTLAHEVTGARDAPEGALASVLTILANLGLIDDSTTAS